jgi:WD40 repeat protein
MKKFTLLVLLVFAALTALTAQTQAALTPEAFLGGHDRFVSSVVFNPDGRRIATASWDKTVKLWNAETGQLIRTLAGHTEAVRTVAFSPDRQRLVSASDDKTIKIWNTETGELMRTLAGHTETVRTVAFSPDGQRIASASNDKTIKLWNAETGQAIRTITGHSSGVYFVAFSSGGTRINSVSFRAIKVFDASTGREISGIDSEDSINFSVAFSPDGRSVTAYIRSQRYLKIWDIETGKVIRTIPLAGKGNVFSVAYSPDGRYIVSGHADNNITIWHVETGRELRTLIGHGASVEAIAFSPDGRRILSGSVDATAKIWDAETGREIRSLPAIPAPLTRELLADYLNAAGANAKTSGPFSGASLYKPAPKETALQFGAMVQKELAVLRFLEPNNAAVGVYEGILRYLTQGNVTRAEIESFYRQNIAAYISAVVDEEFSGLKLPQSYPLPTGTASFFKQSITNFYLSPNQSTYNVIASLPQKIFDLNSAILEYLTGHITTEQFNNITRQLNTTIARNDLHKVSWINVYSYYLGLIATLNKGLYEKMKPR